MMVGALRGDPRDVVRRAVGVVLLIAATVVAAVSAAGLADADRLTTAVVTVLAGSAVTLGFAVGPPVTASVDPLDPRRFAVVGPEPRPLAGALLLPASSASPSWSSWSSGSASPSPGAPTVLRRWRAWHP